MQGCQGSRNLRQWITLHQQSGSRAEVPTMSSFSLCIQSGTQSLSMVMSVFRVRPSPLVKLFWKCHNKTSDARLHDDSKLS